MKDEENFSLYYFFDNFSLRGIVHLSGEHVFSFFSFFFFNFILFLNFT